MIGGNHDRWGGDFWERELGIRFEPLRAEFTVGSRRVAAIHGDGLTEPRLAGHAAAPARSIIPITAAVYRAIHPEIGLRLVDALSPHLGDHTPDEAKLADAAARQARVGRGLLAREPGLGLVVMGHTHRAALGGADAGRHYLNPAPGSTASATQSPPSASAELRQFTPAAPPPPRPDARR